MLQGYDRRLTIFSPYRLEPTAKTAINHSRRNMTAFITPLSIFPSSTSTPSLSNQCKRLRKTRSSQTNRHQTIRAINSPSSPPQASTLVDEVLQAIENTDFGASMPQQTRAKIDRNILALCGIGKYRTNPMVDTRIFNNYTVAYTSSSSAQTGAPAGGRFRSTLGRLFFPTRGLFQHVLSPNIVINLVCFRLLGFLNGCVSLKGTLQSLEPDTGKIEVNFEPPRLRLANAVFEYGPKTTVQLTTTYLDDRVRVGVGGRGSLFVFTSGGLADSMMAQEWKHVFDVKPLPAVLLPLIAVLTIIVVWKSTWVMRAAMLLLVLCMTYVLGRNGTTADDPDPSQRAPAAKKRTSAHEQDTHDN